MTRYIIILACAFLMLSTRGNCETIENTPATDGAYDREVKKQASYEKYLDTLQREHDLFPLNPSSRRNLAEAYATYCLQLLTRKQYEQADTYIVKAMELYPEEAAFAILRGICNYHLKRYDTARYEMERARITTPDSVDLLYYLGLTLYETENRLQAMELWEQALKLAPGRKEIADILARARKETSIESAMDCGRSSRFDLMYDTGVDTSLALAILDVLESAYNQIGAELGYFPETPVPVAIYKRGDFKAITGAPDWSGGAYDGKIRIPFGVLKEITPAVRGILFHEYAHVVIYDSARGNCPQWLNEGIAEYFGRKQHVRTMPDSAQKSGKGASPDFRKLERGFGNLSAADAVAAYEQSYSLVNYLVNTYGWHRITQILSSLGKGMTVDEAIATAFSDLDLDYDGLSREWSERGQTGR